MSGRQVIQRRNKTIGLKKSDYEKKYDRGIAEELLLFFNFQEVKKTNFNFMKEAKVVLNNLGMFIDDFGLFSNTDKNEAEFSFADQLNGFERFQYGSFVVPTQDSKKNQNSDDSYSQTKEKSKKDKINQNFLTWFEKLLAKKSFEYDQLALRFFCFLSFSWVIREVTTKKEKNHRIHSLLLKLLKLFEENFLKEDQDFERKKLLLEATIRFYLLFSNLPDGNKNQILWIQIVFDHLQENIKIFEKLNEKQKNTFSTQIFNYFEAFYFHFSPSFVEKYQERIDESEKKIFEFYLKYKLDNKTENQEEGKQKIIETPQRKRFQTEIQFVQVENFREKCLFDFIFQFSKKYLVNVPLLTKCRKMLPFFSMRRSSYSFKTESKSMDNEKWYRSWKHGKKQKDQLRKKSRDLKQGLISSDSLLKIPESWKKETYLPSFQNCHSRYKYNVYSAKDVRCVIRSRMSSIPRIIRDYNEGNLAFTDKIPRFDY